MSQNKLKYTGLTYDDIQSQIADLIEKNTKLGRFRESSIAQTLIEIFSGSTDMLMYYLNRRAEESYFDTAQLRSSLISLSRMFGYDISRKVPAKANLRVKITGNIEDNQIQIPYYSKFTYSGNNFILVNTLTYRLTNEQYNSMITSTKDNEFELIISTDSFNDKIEITQGDIRDYVIAGVTNPQVGAPFQSYKIEDESFSNIYGGKDYFHNNITQVIIGADKKSGVKFDIDRKSLLNGNYISSSNKLNEAASVCLIRTATDNGVEVVFGDANVGVVNNRYDSQATNGFARKGATTKEENIYIQYLSTNGAVSNKSGVVGDKVSFGGKIYNSKNHDITKNITFYLDSNIYGGADHESMDSIKYSAPKIYYSLDRLVSKQDYIAYLKSLTTPILVKNAIAWGEQEECDNYNAFALVKMFNVVLFSVIGSLYDLTGSTYTPKLDSLIDDAVLDLNYDLNGFQSQGYFNIFIMQRLVKQLLHYRHMFTLYRIDSDNFFDKFDTPANMVPKAYYSDLVNKVADNIKTVIDTAYPTGSAQISFTYRSDIKDNVDYISTSGVIDVQGLNSISGVGVQYLMGLAKLINDKLGEFKDYRGNAIDNKNFKKSAFVSNNTDPIFRLEMTPDLNSDIITNINMIFRVEFDPNTPCYISEFHGDGILSVLKMAFEKCYPVAVHDEGEFNAKISTIIEDLNTRSQVSIKNVYISPIIHKFDLVGTIFIKSLYDKMDAKNTVLNNLYSWLDIHSDFNTPIYLSNIVDAITQYDGVIHADVKLVPNDITVGVNGGGGKNKYYNPNYNTNPIYRKYSHENNHVGDQIANVFESILDEYLNDVDFRTSEYRVLDINGGIHRATETLEYERYELNTKITERTFYMNFAKALYDEFFEKYNAQSKNITIYSRPNEYVLFDNVGKKYVPNYATFLGKFLGNTTDASNSLTIKSDFSILVEHIHKDLSYIIMKNMIDGYGNIDIEYKNGVRSRGGYSLGSEIVQIDGSKLRFEYK